MILPSIFFSFFQNFDFPDCYVSKRAKNGHKLSKNYVCCAPYLQNHTSYIVGTPLPKMESPGGGGGVEMGGLPLFYYFTVQFSCSYFRIFSLFELAVQDFHPCSHPSLVLKPGIICTFRIHSGSLQKMLTTLFNLV